MPSKTPPSSERGQHLDRWGLRRHVGADEFIHLLSVEAGELKLGNDQVVQCMFECAKAQLPFETEGNEARTDVFPSVGGLADSEMN